VKIGRDFFKRSLFLILLLSSGIKLPAQGTLSVISANDGIGQFSWTISAASNVYLDHFQMKLYGVQEAFSPQGWAASIDANDTVIWSFLVGAGGIPFTGSPMTLSIRSASTQSIPYGGIGNTTYPDGLSWGPSAFVRFPYEGPRQVPEPSQGLLWLLAAGIVGIGRRVAITRETSKNRRRAKSNFSSVTETRKPWKGDQAIPVLFSASSACTP
jgi:hypothetical protein